MARFVSINGNVPAYNCNPCECKEQLHTIIGGATVHYSGGPDDGIGVSPQPVTPSCTPIALHSGQVTVQYTTRNIPVGNYTKVSGSTVQGGPYVTPFAANRNGDGSAQKVETITVSQGNGVLAPGTRYYWVVEQWQRNAVDPNDDVLISTSSECTFQTLSVENENYFTCAPNNNTVPQGRNYIRGGANIGPQGDIALPSGSFDLLTEISISPNGPWQLASDMESPAQVGGPYNQNPFLAPNFLDVDWYTLPGGLTPATDYYLRMTYRLIRLPGPTFITVQQSVCGPYRTAA